LRPRAHWFLLEGVPCGYGAGKSSRAHSSSTFEPVAQPLPETRVDGGDREEEEEKKKKKKKKKKKSVHRVRSCGDVTTLHPSRVLRLSRSPWGSALS
jgi:hypothetical protein